MSTQQLPVVQSWPAHTGSYSKSSAVPLGLGDTESDFTLNQTLRPLDGSRGEGTADQFYTLPGAPMSPSVPWERLLKATVGGPGCAVITAPLGTLASFSEIRLPNVGAFVHVRWDGEQWSAFGVGAGGAVTPPVNVVLALPAPPPEGA